MKYDIARIKAQLPALSLLFERHGHSVQRMGSARFACCPFHEEKTPSCQVDDDRNRFHCFGCGASGDSMDFWQKSRGLSFQDALTELAGLAGVGPETDLSSRAKPLPAPKKEEEKIGPMTADQIARWNEACERLAKSDTEIRRIAKWRGIEADCVKWAAERGLMGTYLWWDLPREAFLVEMPTPGGVVPVSVHIRLSPGSKGHHGRDGKASWNFDPKRKGAWPFVIGKPATADYIFLLEGQWDALALVSMMGWHRREKWPRIAVIGLRGSTSGGKLTAYELNPKARLFAIADADGAGAGWFEENGLLDKLHGRVRDVIAFWPTEEKRDLNDLVKSGELDRDMMLHHLTPLMPPRKRPTLTFLKWCLKHKGADSEIGRAATYVTNDRARPKGRRPLRDWDRHWRKCRVPEELYQDLSIAWARYQSEKSQPDPTLELPLAG